MARRGLVGSPAPPADCPGPRSTSPILFVRYGEVALPAGIAGVGLGQALSDGEDGLVGRRAPPAGCPAPRSTSPILLCDTERSRCHPALPGSALAMGSAIAAAVLVEPQGVRQAALRQGDVARARASPSSARVGSLAVARLQGRLLEGDLGLVRAARVHAARA